MMLNSDPASPALQTEYDVQVKQVTVTYDDDSVSFGAGDYVEFTQELRMSGKCQSFYGNITNFR